MGKMLSEGVRCPDELDPYAENQRVPADQLVPFMGKWKVHRKALDNFQGFVDAARAAGVGIVPIPGAASAYRPISDQEALFKSRYAPGPGPNQKVWNGRPYHLKPGMAMAAVPGKSMHGLGLAIDFMRDNGRAINAAERAKLREIGKRFQIADTVKSENWHFACQNADGVAGHPITGAPAPVDPGFAEKAKRMQVLRLGDQHLLVAFVENVLRDKAGQREIGESTGTFDARVQTALKNLQAFNRLPVTGEVDAPTWELLLKLDAGLA